MVAMAWSLDELIFPTHAVAPADPLPPGAERLSLDAPGGARLHGVHIPPAAGSDGPRTLVIGFGGNAWNGENVATFLHQLYPEADVAAFHYRGYRPSTGRPSADALVEDAPLALALAVRRVKPERVIAVGFSIGSGVAASLAKSSAVDGLILVTPFDSLKLVARDLYPWVPALTLAFRHELDAAGFLRGTQVPTAIVAAERDEIVPPSRTEALRSQAPNLVFDRTIGGAGHNDIYARSDFHQAMREALEAVTRQGPKRR
jgi:pimeloyl-ACP methyl ester carboxylesterase